MSASDTEQLHRIERCIAGLEFRPSRDQMPPKCLIDGLRREQRKLLSEPVLERKLGFSTDLVLALRRSPERKPRR